MTIVPGGNYPGLYNDYVKVISGTYEGVVFHSLPEIWARLIWTYNVGSRFQGRGLGKLTVLGSRRRVPCFWCRASLRLGCKD